MNNMQSVMQGAVSFTTYGTAMTWQWSADNAILMVRSRCLLIIQKDNLVTPQKIQELLNINLASDCSNNFFLYSFQELFPECYHLFLEEFSEIFDVVHSNLTGL